MSKGGDRKSADAAEEAMLIVKITKALYSKDIDEIFRILGRYLDKYKLQVSPDVLNEYDIAGRIRRP